jgi:hypothetical protein
VFIIIGKIAISTFKYLQKNGSEELHQKLPENSGSDATTAMTSVTATPNKKATSSFAEFVSNIFGLWPNLDRSCRSIGTGLTFVTAVTYGAIRSRHIPTRGN